MTEGYTIVIPARYASSRFPGKPLQLLNGRPMLLHVIERAGESTADRVVVATDDERIVQLCQDADTDVEMTRADHPSGTDRIAEVAQRRGWHADTRVVGLQGDEPATPAAHLDRLAANLLNNPDANMATLSTPITALADYQNPNRVKLVRDARGYAMYFSRAAIPWRRDAKEASAYPDALLHVGLYAYRCDYLLNYSQLPACDIEQEEQLEQLRVLHHGGRIHVDVIDGMSVAGVDMPEDVANAEAALNSLEIKQ